MLPIPFRNHIPKALKQDFDTDEGGQALATKVDNHLIEWLSEIRELKNLRNPVKCPAVVLDPLGYQLGAGIKNYDSERTKRKKIATSVSGLKKRGTWKYDIKNKIDAITGASSQLVRNQINGVWVVMCDEIDDPDPFTHYWGTVSDEFTSDDLGLVIEDTTMNLLSAGIIRIDIGLDDSPESEILVDKIKIEIQDDFTPAYMQIQLGYININGIFTTYNNGIL